MKKVKINEHCANQKLIGATGYILEQQPQGWRKNAPDESFIMLPKWDRIVLLKNSMLDELITTA